VDFVHRPEFERSKEQYFGNWIFFPFSGENVESTYAVGSLKTSSLQALAAADND
jgi:hypothetical protein